MDRLFAILLAASFALTAVAAISDRAVGAGSAGPAPAVQESHPDPAAESTRAAGPGAR